MSFISCLNDDSAVLVLDASVVVNLNATGCADRFIGALRNPCVVTHNVLAELEFGETRGYSDATQLKALIAKKLVTDVKLDNAMRDQYLHLVAGRTADTLDDGEAATLAYASADGAWAAVDERKALRICREQFPSLRTASTVDILAGQTLGLSRATLAEATFNALSDARMRVFEHQVDWIIELVGSERARQCPSLPGRHRIGR